MIIAVRIFTEVVKLVDEERGFHTVFVLSTYSTAVTV